MYFLYLPGPILQGYENNRNICILTAGHSITGNNLAREVSPVRSPIDFLAGSGFLMTSSFQWFFLALGQESLKDIKNLITIIKIVNQRLRIGRDS